MCRDNASLRGTTVLVGKERKSFATVSVDKFAKDCHPNRYLYASLREDPLFWYGFNQGQPDKLV